MPKNLRSIYLRALDIFDFFFVGFTDLYFLSIFLLLLANFQEQFQSNVYLMQLLFILKKKIYFGSMKLRRGHYTLSEIAKRSKFSPPKHQKSYGKNGYATTQ